MAWVAKRWDHHLKEVRLLQLLKVTHEPIEKTAHIRPLQVADGHMVISATVSSSVRTWHSQEARILYINVF